MERNPNGPGFKIAYGGQSGSIPQSYLENIVRSNNNNNNNNKSSTNTMFLYYIHIINNIFILIRKYSKYHYPT